MSNTFEIPKSIISTVLYRQTGVLVEPHRIDFVSAHNIAEAVVAFDEGYIDREKFNRVVIFNINQLLEREGKMLFYQARTNQEQFTKFRVTFFYN